MNLTHTLPTMPYTLPTLDYAWLRATGIRQLERLTAGEWTDFNAHDPGITILEQFCYALTDLSYRIDYDLKDLLTGEEGEPYRDLFTPATILTTNPVTLTDLRQVVLDVAGVKNAWVATQATVAPAPLYDPADQSLYLQPGPQRQPLVLPGVYQILIEADDGVDTIALQGAVSQRLHACRNLGEAFDPPTVLPQQPITVVATLEVAAVADPNQLLATIYHRLVNWIAPRVRFYTLAELLAQGEPLEAIMEGPRLEHGFLRTADLDRLGEKRVGLRTSDLIQELMNVADVRAVNQISLWDVDPKAGAPKEDWYLPLNPGKVPMLDLTRALSATPPIQLVHQGQPIATDPVQTKQIFDQLQQAERAMPQPAAQRDRHLPSGRNRHIARYQTIQQQLPALYGVGEGGLPAGAGAARQVQAKQLQAYLLFFDQLLANAFAQVAHVKDLFAFTSGVGADDASPQSYFSQPLADPRLGLTDLWVEPQPAVRATRLQALTETPAAAIARKQRFLNHLLARFAESFTDFQLDQTAPTTLLQTKAAFLQAYPDLSANRGRAANLTRPADTAQGFDRAGLEKRISHKLGLGALPAAAAGGFYLVEHILLRPQEADRVATSLTTAEIGWQEGVLLALPTAADQPVRPDPYSQQLSFVFPGWLTRFQPDARPFIAQLLREESPAHLGLHLHWATADEMARFEAAYFAWRSALALPPSDTKRLPERVARDFLIDWLKLGLPYPLRDLPLDYDNMIPHGLTAAVQIRYAQLGVTYYLCDEEGNPFTGTGVTVARDAHPTTATATLVTPPIEKDVIFTILAVRDRQAGPLESYLKQTVAIKAGINRALVVAFSAGGQPFDAASPLIDYNATVTVRISHSQAGISYQVVAADGQSLSAPKPGGEAQIDLITDPLREDTTLQIKAYRTGDTDTEDADTAARLTTTLALQVRPNPQVVVRVGSPIVFYQGETTVHLDNAQGSATYQLYQRQLVAADYGAAATAGALVVKGEGDRLVYLHAPAPITDWANPAPFVLVDAPFTVQADGTMAATVTGLTEDTLLVVHARKSANGSSLPLAQAAAILVHPNPAPRVGAVSTTLLSGDEGVVTVNDTQAGVAYQLQINNQSVNTPGYDYRDRAIETARVGVDLVVEPLDDAAADQTLYLPTGPLTKNTRYTVLATKIRTGLRIPLTSQVRITVTSPSGSAPANAAVPAARASAPAENVAAADSGPEVSPEQAVVDYGQATRVRIKASRAQEWYQLWLADQPLGDPVKGTGRDRLLATPPLQSDTRLALHITQPNDPAAAERVIEVLVQVRPDSTLTVNAAETVAANEATQITVAASQVGVQYQLWAGDQPVGAPVDGDGSVIALPTGPLTAITTFTIRATRLDQPALFVDLAQQVTVRVG